MYETGHYSQCVSGIIDSFHSFLDYLFLVHITNKSLKKELKDNPGDYNSKDKTTWLFEMVAGKTLKQLLHENSKQDLYVLYKKYRNLRTKIAHPAHSGGPDVTYEDARKACKTIVDIIDLIRQKILKDDAFDLFLFSLKHYFH